jgi:hypothetical protein
LYKNIDLLLSMEANLHKSSSHLNQKPRSRNRRRKSIGQSLVEFAIALPVLILLFSGLVEFGFILNYYLSLLDATREASRYYAQFDPFMDANGDTFPDDADSDGYPDIDPDYFQGAADWVRGNLEPTDSLDTSRKIVLNPETDDVLVTIVDVQGTDLTRYPITGAWHGLDNLSLESKFVTDDYILDNLVTGAPNTIILIVEVYYSYHQILALPWLAPFLSNPVQLHAFSMMPLPPLTFSSP